MYIQINQRSTTPLYEQLTQQIKELVAKGILQEGEQLPSVRELASQVVINPNTVSKAYKELERQGVIVTLRGKGTFVAAREDYVVDPKQQERIKQQIQQLVIEATYAGIQEKTFAGWVREEYTKVGGTEHAD
ncbi:GntR family transcriptional regulator [Halalkalibacter oceani]|uniref:GntR family transcriptional regulator n=1 Tax=Halalkalibacter oceani TaxID=1653776 RepID=UPI00339109BE